MSEKPAIDKDTLSLPESTPSIPSLEQRSITGEHGSSSITNKVTVLLIGPPKSGKSTLLQSLRFSFGEDSTPEKRNVFKPQIFRQLAAAAQSLVSYLDTLDRPTAVDDFYRYKLEAALRKVTNAFKNGLGYLPEVFVDSVRNVCRDTAVAKSFVKSDADVLGLSESELYFLTNIGRIGDVNYIPTQDDVLRTWGADKTKKSTTPTVLKSPRRELIIYKRSIGNGIDSMVEGLATVDPDLIIYCLPLDDPTNLMDLVNIWVDVVDQASDIPILLVFNKPDIFARKLDQAVWETTFPLVQFQFGSGNRLVELALLSIQSFFKSAVTREDNIFLCFTEATDASLVGTLSLNIEKVLSGTG